MSDRPATLPGAVFLSYASQDAAAAARLAEALRAAGVEVWFDKDELVGGDAWDAKIRRQIAECALFVPVISAATQARLEGYFRIEWKLAARRTHAMAMAKAFLLPVVIDATRDAEAHVPDEFREVQWTRLPEGEAAEKFCGRVRHLLEGERAVAGSEAGARLVHAQEDGRGRAAPLRGKRGPVLAGVLAAAVTVGAAWWVTKKTPETVARVDSKTPVTSVAPIPAAPKAEDKSLAVLPFANVGGDKEQEYFSDGLTLEIHKAIERERDLRVTGQASSFSFRGKNASAKEIAAALNVSRLVEGSVQRIGSKVRIRVSLTRVADNTSEDLGTFTEEIADVFSLYDKVAGAVVGKLTRRPFVSNVDVLTRNPEAYNLYLKGRALQTVKADNATVAAGFFERAVDLDPGFALAWARLAETRFRPFAQLDRSADVVNKSRLAIDRALIAQPDLPEALIVRANWIRWVEFDFAAAQRDLARAESLRAPSAELRYAQFLLARDQGNWSEAFRFAQDCLRLDPQNGDHVLAVGVNTSGRGNFKEVDDLYARAQEIQGPAGATPFNNRLINRLNWRGAEAALRLWNRAPPEQARLPFMHATLLLAAGRIAEAQAVVGGISVSAEGLAIGDLRSSGGRILAALGLEDRARLWAQAARTEGLKQLARGNRAPAVQRFLIDAEIILGHRDSALTLLKEWEAETRRLPSLARRIEFNQSAAQLFARLGMVNETVALLRESAENGFVSLGFSLRESESYKLVRNDPRFQELMQQAEAWAKAQPDPVEP